VPLVVIRATWPGKSHRSFWSLRKFVGSFRTETSRHSGEFPVVCAGSAAAGIASAGASSWPWRMPGIARKQQNTN